MIESELFGHEKGSFTGAVDQRIGRFELAHGGTLFLDEIGEISASFQAKLLRVLQEGEFERVGGAKTIKVDVRIVCATNRNLEEAVASGAFPRRSLLPHQCRDPARASLAGKAGRHCNPGATVPRAASRRRTAGKCFFRQDRWNLLGQCAFPGNVRELENCVRRTAALAAGSEIQSRLTSPAPRAPACRRLCGKATPRCRRRRAALAAASGAGGRTADLCAPIGDAGRLSGARRLPGRQSGQIGARRALIEAMEKHRLGAGQGRPPARPHPAPDRLRPAQAGYRHQAALIQFRMNHSELYSAGAKIRPRHRGFSRHGVSAIASNLAETV